MQPVLFSIFGFDVQTYGVSKALAAWVAALLLARAFEARGLDRERAYSFVLWSTVWGFAAAKVYFLFEQFPTLTVHDFSGMGITWYGGLIGGALAAMVIVRRWQLPLGTVAGAAAAPLSVGYAIGRLGCLLSGDGTYGRPTTLPWGIAFPNGVVATDVPVHPTPLYEAIGALVIAGSLWWLGRRASGPAVFAGYLILSGLARFLVEFLRTNSTGFLGMTQPQLWALVGMGAGVLLARAGLRGGSNEPVPIHGSVPAASAGTSDPERAGLAR